MSWSQTSAPSSEYWQSVASSSDGTKLVAVVNGGGIYTSIDSGVIWTPQTNGLPATANWSSVASSSDGTKLVAVVRNGNIYTSTNSGVDWTETNAPTAYWRSVASSSDGTKLVAVINSGGTFITGIYTSNNSGLDWIQQTIGASYIPFTSVASSSDGTKIVFTFFSPNTGDSGIYTGFTSDYISYNWTLTTAPSNSWYSVASDSTGQYLVAVVFVGGIYTSTDSGDSWTLQSGAPTTNWTSVASSSDGTKLVAVAGAVVRGGNIYTSTNSGVDWTETNAPSDGWSSVASSSDGTKLVAVVGYDTSGGIYTSSPPIPYPCFKEDSKILTKIGYVPIQKLRKGDLVKTLNHGFVPINMIGCRILNNPICEERIKDKLYVCHQSEYPEVFEDLVITGCHSILVDEFKNIEEREKTNEVLGYICVTDNKYRLPACVDEKTKPYEEAGEFKIYHVALENDDYYMNYGIYANGLLVESTSQRYLKELSGMTLLHI